MSDAPEAGAGRRKRREVVRPEDAPLGKPEPLVRSKPEAPKVDEWPRREWFRDWVAAWATAALLGMALICLIFVVGAIWMFGPCPTGPDASSVCTAERKEMLVGLLKHLDDFTFKFVLPLISGLFGYMFGHRAMK